VDKDRCFRQGFYVMLLLKVNLSGLDSVDVYMTEDRRHEDNDMVWKLPLGMSVW